MALQTYRKLGSARGFANGHAAQTLTATTANAQNVINFSAVGAASTSDMVWIPATSRWRVPRNGVYSINARVGFAAQTWVVPTTVGSMSLAVAVNGVKKIYGGHAAFIAATRASILLYHEINVPALRLAALDEVNIECVFEVALTANKALSVTSLDTLVYFNVMELLTI